MPASSRLLAGSGALLASLLLGACGTQTPGSGTAAAPDSSPASPCGAVRGADSDLARDGVRIVAMTGPSGGPSADSSGGSPDTAAPSPDGRVRAERLPTAYGARCAAVYTVTNDASEPYTYTVTFSLVNGRGEALANVEETVADVAPGRTVRRTLPMEGAAAPERARILDVKRVPADEAPRRGGPCPASGVRVSVDRGDAAMGLRVVGLHLVNCGSRPYSLNGYPLLELLDGDLAPVDGVEILDGTGGIPMAGESEPPRPVTLRPGQAAVANLAWRNTTESGEAVNVPHVRVRARAGAAPVIVSPELDLGTTGRLGVSAWRAYPPQTGAPDRPQSS